MLRDYIGGIALVATFCALIFIGHGFGL